MKKSRSFAEVLAEWQGVIRPKPGTTYMIENVPEKVIVEVWGYVPSAIAFEGTTLLFKKQHPGFYRATVHFT